MDEISRVNRGLMCPAVTTGRVLGGLWWGPLCATPGPLCVWANAGQGGGVRTPRAEGGTGTSRARPWQGGCGPGRGREDMGPCRTRPRQARPSRVAEGLGDAGFHVGTILLGRYVAVRRAKYPRRPRHGTSKRARRRARPRQARPSRVVEGVGDVGFHFGAVPPGRYAARRRGTSKQARRRARPRQARPSRVAEVQETRDFTSEQFRSEIPHPQTHGGSVAELCSAQKKKGAVVGADVPGGPTPARNAVGRLTAWARAGARDARPYQCRGIPLCATPGPLCVTSGPLCTRANQCGRSVRTSRADGGADTSHAGGAFMCGSYRNTKPKRLGNASVWC